MMIMLHGQDSHQIRIMEPLDFCTSDGDGTVESWFELLQYWFNDSSAVPNIYNPSPKE